MALLAAYSFDEAGTTVTDYSGNARSWTLNNGAQRNAGGHTNGGITRVGSGSLPVVASPAFGQTTGRTVMFWQKGTGDSVWSIRWTIAPDVAAWGIYRLGGINLRTRIGGSASQINAADPLGDGNWHHFAGTHDGSTVRLFIDGVQVASATRAGTIDTADRIDFMEHTTGGAIYDDLRIYDEALDQATIATLMATPVASGPAPVENVTGSLGLTMGLTGTLTAPPATIASLSGATALTLSHSGTLTAPPASIAEVTGALPLTLGTTGELAAPAASVESLTGSVSLTLGTTGALDIPASSVPSLTGSLPLSLAHSGVLTVPTASVPELTGSLALALGMHGMLRDPNRGETPGTLILKAIPGRNSLVALPERLTLTALED